MLLAEKYYTPSKNCFKHVKTSFFSTSGSGNLPGFGELVIEDPLQWDCNDSPGKHSIQDIQMKTMSLTGKDKFFLRDISSTSSSFTTLQWTTLPNKF